MANHTITNALLLLAGIFSLMAIPLTAAGAEQSDSPAAALDAFGRDDDFTDSFATGFTDSPPCPPGADARTRCGYSANGRWARLSWAWVSDLEPELVAVQRGQLLLTVPGNGENRGGQIETLRSDYWYGTYRARIKAGTHSGTPQQGSVNAFFFYDSDTEQEIDVEILTKDNSARVVNFVTHPGNYVTTCRLSADPSTQFIEYGFDWYADKVVYFVNGKKCAQETRGVPDDPGRIILNHWTGNIWAGSAPPQSSVMRVDYVRYSSFLLLKVPTKPGIIWSRGATKAITWNKFGDVAAAPVTIELWKGGAFRQTIATNAANTGSYRWTIPAALPAAADYSIKIKSALNGDYYDFSKADFAIR